MSESAFQIARFQEVVDEDVEDIVKRIFAPTPVAKEVAKIRFAGIGVGTDERRSYRRCIYCCKGEIHLITDVDDIVLRLATLSSFRGTNHAWSNQSNEPALLVGCMIDAHPLP